MKKNFKVKSKSRETLESFIDYCIAHPEERFWQALRNWSSFSSIYVGEEIIEELGLIDTFYFEGKNK